MNHRHRSSSSQSLPPAPSSAIPVAIGSEITKETTTATMVLETAASTTETKRTQSIGSTEPALTTNAEIFSSHNVDVNSILSKEWLRLSLKDRNNIQEEIHSVMCMAPEESPEMIQKALEQFSFELNHNIPEKDRSAYKKYQEFLSFQANAKTNNDNDNDFRLRFLRQELFDVPKAARRMCRFLDSLLENFGKDSLKQPVKLANDFSKNEIKILRKGLVQILPYRDRLGRRIIVFFPGIQLARVPFQTKMKIMLYMFYTAGSNNDVDTQRKGFVAVIWFDPSTIFDTPSRMGSNVGIFITSLPSLATRIAAIHLCTPDTPMFNLRKAIFAAVLSSHERTRTIVHTGTPMELRYALNGYGIPTDSLPISWTGKIKTAYLKQWIRVRQSIEEDDDSYTSGSSSLTSSSNTTANEQPPLRQQQQQQQRQLVVECPSLNDIVFKRGSSGTLHPGNVRFRSLVQSKYEQGNLLTTKSLITATLAEIDKQKLRILVWDEHKSSFFVVNNPQIIYKKVEYFVRDFQFSSTKSQTINRRIADSIATNTSSSSSTKQQQQQQTPTPTRTAHTGNTSGTHTTITLQNDNTSIFLAQDRPSRKRFKPNQYSSNGEDCCEGMTNICE